MTVYSTQRTPRTQRNTRSQTDLPSVSFVSFVFDHLQTAVDRDPGLTTGKPCEQAGHLSGSYTGSVSSSSATYGTSSCTPVPRLTIDAAPTTWPPAARATWIVSRVDPAVVTTSSTTRTRSLSPMTNP